MPEDSAPPDVTSLVSRMRAGDAAAREQLVTHMYGRLLRLARKMRRGAGPAFSRWEQTEDLLHAAWFRVQRALEDDSVDVRDAFHLFRIAARHMRWELTDVCRKNTGAEKGFAAKHHSVPAEQREGGGLYDRLGCETPGDDQARYESFEQLHRQVEALPDDEQAVVDMLWYHGLTQQQAADLLGVAEKTVQRRWRRAQRKLAATLPPPSG